MSFSSSSYIKLPKESDHPRKGLIDIKNIGDNEYLKWCLARCLPPADHEPARIRKVDKSLHRNLILRA